MYNFTYFVKYSTGLVSNSSCAAFFKIEIKGINASLELLRMLNLRPSIYLKNTDEV